MLWTTQLAEYLTPTLNIDDPEARVSQPNVYFLRWDGPLRVGLEGDEHGEVQRLIRRFIAYVEGEEVECHLIVDTLELKAWVNSAGVRQTSRIKIDLPSYVAK
jgi:hypothetical protein